MRIPVMATKPKKMSVAFLIHFVPALEAKRNPKMAMPKIIAITDPLTPEPKTPRVHIKNAAKKYFCFLEESPGRKASIKAKKAFTIT